MSKFIQEIDKLTKMSIKNKSDRKDNLQLLGEIRQEINVWRKQKEIDKAKSLATLSKTTQVQRKLKIDGKIATTPEYLLADIQIRDMSGKRLIKTIFDYIYTSVLNNKEKVITIATLGDDIEGLIQKGSMKNALSSTQQAVVFSNAIASGLYELSKITKINFLYIADSNHGELRPYGSKRSEFPDEQLGQLIEHSLITDYRICKNKNISWVGKPTEYGAKIFGNSLYIHSHQPLISQNLVSFLSSLPKNIKYIKSGHGHTYWSKDVAGNWIWIQVPALKDWKGDYEKQHGFPINPRFIKFIQKNSKDYSMEMISIEQKYRSVNRASRKKSK